MLTRLPEQTPECPDAIAPRHYAEHTDDEIHAQVRPIQQLKLGGYAHNTVFRIEGPHPIAAEKQGAHQGAVHERIAKIHKEPERQCPSQPLDAEPRRDHVEAEQEDERGTPEVGLSVSPEPEDKDEAPSSIEQRAERGENPIRGRNDTPGLHADQLQDFWGMAQRNCVTPDPIRGYRTEQVFRMRTGEERKVHGQADDHEGKRGGNTSRRRSHQQGEEKDGKVLPNARAKREHDRRKDGALGQRQRHGADSTGHRNRVELAVVHGQQQRHRVEHVCDGSGRPTAHRSGQYEGDDEIPEDRGHLRPEHEWNTGCARRVQHGAGDHIVAEYEKRRAVARAGLIENIPSAPKSLGFLEAMADVGGAANKHGGGEFKSGGEKQEDGKAHRLVSQPP